MYVYAFHYLHVYRAIHSKCLTRQFKITNSNRKEKSIKMTKFHASSIFICTKYLCKYIKDKRGN